MKSCNVSSSEIQACRSPCGERGLKYYAGVWYIPERASLPVRGAWVEMTKRLLLPVKAQGRSPCGERGLK